jgi:hypothetical protein
MTYVDPLLESLHEVLLGNACAGLAAATAEQVVATTTHPPHACYISIVKILLA